MLTFISWEFTKEVWVEMHSTLSPSSFFVLAVHMSSYYNQICNISVQTVVFRDIYLDFSLSLELIDVKIH